MLNRLHAHTLRVGRNKDESEIAMARAWLARAAETVDVIRPVRAGAPALGAVDDDLAALALHPRLDTRQVAADIRLRQAIG